MITEKITREIFADEKSKKIFDYRYRYYKTGDMENILDMVIDEYGDFSRRIDVLRGEIVDKIKAFSGRLVIYGAGVHAGYAMRFLQREHLDNRYAFSIVSENQGTVVSIDSLKDTGEYMVLVPEGVYSFEMMENLRLHGWSIDRYLMIPLALLFDNRLPDSSNIGNILRNRNNHFIVYGADWNSVLFKSLMRGTKRHYDFSIAE